MGDVSSDPKPFVPTPRRAHVVHAWLAKPALTELNSEAIRRRVHPDALAAAIVDRVIGAGLVDQLLDDPRFA